MDQNPAPDQNTRKFYIYIYNTPPPPLYSENDDDENGGDNKINEE